MTQSRGHDRKHRSYTTCHADVSRSARRLPWCLPLCFALILAGALGFVWLRSGGENLAQQRQSLRQAYAHKAKEIENVRLELESFRAGRYILVEARRLGLNLRPPVPGQVRRLPGPAQPDAPRAGDEGLLAATR